MLLPFHVVISVVGIVAGLLVIGGMLAGGVLPKWTAVFLATTVATSVTGFLFPFGGVTPGIVLGVISLALLAAAIVARYPKRLAGPWRGVYVVTAIAAQYLNVFVLIVQSFQKVELLAEAAPNQNEPPFVAVQVATLALFIGLTIAAWKSFRPTTSWSA